MLRSNLANLQTEIETPYQARGTITRENGRQASILDHFETATFYTFTPTSGAPVDFSTDLEAAKQYFSEHPDATGTFTETLDMHEYQKQNYTYDLIVQESSQAESVITAATIENAKFNYQPGDAPRRQRHKWRLPIRTNMRLNMNAGNSLKTTNRLPHGIPITALMARCRPSQNLKAERNMCILLC